MRLPDPSLKWPINREGIYLLCERETCRLNAYPDYPGRRPTIGWGETEGVTLGMTWTSEQADERLLSELNKYTHAVLDMCKMQPGPNQLAALVVCAYNIGIEGMRGSTMLRLHNSGNFTSAAQSFSLWNKATTPDGRLVVVAGLTIRRMKEAALYLTPDEGTPAIPPTQVVVAEPSLIQSPTVQANTAAVAVGGLTLASSFLSSLQPVVAQAKALAADIGASPVEVVAGVALLVGVVSLYRRWRQRRLGVA